MKSSPVGRAAPLILAATLALSYAALIIVLPSSMEQFADFKIEMSALTFWAIRFVRLITAPLPGIAFGLVLVSLSFAIAIGEKWAWWTGLLLTTFFGICLFSAVLPIITIAKDLNGDEAGIFATVPWPYVLSNFCLNLLPSINFLVLRRAFWNKRSHSNQTFPT